MEIMDKLARLFQRPEIPPEARSIFQGARDPAQLREGLDALRARNEINLQEHEERMLSLEGGIEKYEQQVRENGLGREGQDVILRRVLRMRKEMDNLKGLITIYDDNTGLLLNLVARIQEMEAKKAIGVSEGDIDSFLEGVDANFQDYRHMRLAGNDADRSRVVQAADRKDLDELRMRILTQQAVPGSSRRQRDVELE